MTARVIDSDNGVLTRIYHQADRVVVEKLQDIKAIVEANKRQANAVTTLSKMGDGMHHVGRIPVVVMERWMKEDGINYLAKENSHLLMRKLHERDNKVFKVDPRNFV